MIKKLIMIVHNFISWGFTHNDIDHHRNSVKVKYTQMIHKNIKFLNATVFFFDWHLKKTRTTFKNTIWNFYWICLFNVSEFYPCFGTSYTISIISFIRLVRLTVAKIVESVWKNAWYIFQLNTSLQLSLYFHLKRQS